MITVPPQELAIFLGNHLEQVLQRTGRDFVQSVAANRQFRAGCALMDVLNDVESVQGRIRAFLQERRNSNGDQETIEPVKVRITSLYLLYSLYSQFPIHQNPFLCFFVDIYTTSLLDEQQRPERFVASVILNGDGDELSPSTPSELIMIAREVESRRLNLRFLDDFLPDVPVKDQVVPGLGWETFGVQRPGDQEYWRVLNLQDSFGGAGRLQVQGDHTKDDGDSLLHGGDNVNGDNGGPLETVSTTGTGSQGPKKDACSDGEVEEEEEQELEEWEIEAEKHFQDSEDVAPAPAKAIAKPKKSADPPFNRQQLNAIMEQAAIQPLTFVEEQFMLSQFNADAVKVHIPLPLPDALPGIVDNNPPIAFNLLLYLSQLSSDLDGGDAGPANQRSNGGSDGSGRASAKSSSFNSPEPSLVDAYLDTLNYAKHLTLHSVEVVNRLATATTLPSRFLHAYIENGIRCCEQVEDKVGQTRQIQLLSKLLQSLLASETITIPDYFHALQSFCVQFSRVKEVAVLFQSLMDYQRKNDTQSPVQNQGLSIRATQQPTPLQQQQQQSNSRTLPQSASMPSTPTTDTPQRSSWLASSGSIANVKSTLSKHNSLNGFSAPGALSQFIHPGPASPAGTSSSSSGGGSNHQNGGGYSSNHSFSNGTGSGSSYFKTHQKHSSQHSSSTGSLFSSSGVMSASVNAFNSGLGNPTSLTLNGGSSNNNGGGSGVGSFRSRSSSTITTSASGSGGTMDNGYEDAAPRTTTPSGTSGSGGGASNSSGSSRPLSSGSQQQQQQQTIHLGPKGFNTASHLGNHARGRGARRGG